MTGERLKEFTIIVKMKNKHLNRDKAAKELQIIEAVAEKRGYSVVEKHIKGGEG